MYISSRPSPGMSRDSTHSLQVDCVLLGERRAPFLLDKQQNAWAMLHMRIHQT
jgi:hypothetical protein